MRIGEGPNARFGQGQYVEGLPQLIWQRWKDFSGGYVSSDTQDEIAPNATPNALDIEVDSKDRLVRSAGTTLYEALDGHVVKQIAVQASLDYTAELILFAPPYIGIRTTGPTEWYDVGLPISANRQYEWTNFGGTLLFGNGLEGMYARENATTEIALVDGAPAAVDYMSFAGRVFALGAIIGGNREPLGVVWSAATSLHDDWDGLGNGFELLIDDMSAGDRIVAGRSMGLDAAAILCRHSIWVARRTGQRDRPADFQSAVPGVGAVTSACVRTTRFGVLFLSDSGVYLFNGNSAELVSEAINADLLVDGRIDYTQLNKYRAIYNPATKRYTLFAPSGTWVFEIEKKRWFRRSIQPNDAVLFAQQFDALTWDEMVGTWDEQTLVWEDLRPAEANKADLIFLQEGTPDSALWIEDPLSMTTFGEPMIPFWEFPQITGEYLNQLLTVKKVNVDYISGGTVELWTPDLEGDFSLFRTKVLPLATARRTRGVMGEKTGKGAGVKLVMTAGRPVISKVELGLLLRSQRIENTVFVPREYYDDFA